MTSLATGLLLLLGAPAPSAGASTGSSTCSMTSSPTPPARQGHFLGVEPKAQRPAPMVCAAVVPLATVHTTEAKFHGKPPLLDNGGPVMGTATPGEVTVTPIYWGPANSFDPSFKAVVDQYLTDVAHDSGQLTNVYSTTLQLGINYIVHAGAAVSDTNPYPGNGCTPDSRVVYADNSGYSACVDDAQLQSELSTVLSAHSLSSDLAHLYLIMLPKGVESCALPGNGASGNCSSPWVSSGFCGYHSFFGAGSPPIYADIPFPSYNAPTPFSCASGVESLNGNTDADVVLSTVSHETAEAITDPLGTAWWDIRGNEIGDDCAYIYGTLSGTTPGAQWNQTINGHDYFTQEEVSNENYTYAKRSACVQAVNLPAASLRITPLTLKAAHTVTFDAHRSMGGNMTFGWDFGDGNTMTTGPASTGKKVLGTNAVTHVYPTTGGTATYTVTLTITDVMGLQHTTSTVQQIISVSG